LRPVPRCGTRCVKGGAKGRRKVDRVTNTPTQAQPATVSQRTKQAGETLARWAWVEAAVWTERMRMALENGVQGGVWFSLMDKVERPANLRSAFAKVKANRGAAGVDHQTVAMVA